MLGCLLLIEESVVTTAHGLLLESIQFNMKRAELLKEVISTTKDALFAQIFIHNDVIKWVKVKGVDKTQFDAVIQLYLECSLCFVPGFKGRRDEGLFAEGFFVGFIPPTVANLQEVQCLIEYAKTTKGTVLEDEIVDATKVSFGLGESWIVCTACKAIVTETIGGSKEHAETTKRRADRFRHSRSLDRGWGRRQGR
jgi:hypothetical protein